MFQGYINDDGIETRTVGGMLEIAFFQDNAVVSRTVIDGNSGTWTLFAIYDYKGLSKHTAPYDAPIYILDRTLSILILERSLRLDTEQGVII